MSEQRLGQEWAGSVSSGTMREEDLIPAFEDVLDRAGVGYDRPEAVGRLLDGQELSEADWDTVSWYVNEELWGALEDVAPEGTSFGAHEGDGADYGFWAYEQEPSDDDDDDTAAGDELVDLCDDEPVPQCGHCGKAVDTDGGRTAQRHGFPVYCGSECIRRDFGGGEPLFDAPNLDGLSIDPADLDRAADVFRLLASYAQAKAQAMRLRLAGDVNQAVAMERYCDAEYKRLPEWARW
jgi:hypothetical protein